MDLFLLVHWAQITFYLRDSEIYCTGEVSLWLEAEHLDYDGKETEQIVQSHKCVCVLSLLNMPNELWTVSQLTFSWAANGDPAVKDIRLIIWLIFQFLQNNLPFLNPHQLSEVSQKEVVRTSEVFVLFVFKCEQNQHISSLLSRPLWLELATFTQCF